MISVLSAPRGDASLDQQLSPFGAALPFAKDEEIFGQEEPVDFLYVVLSGAVRTTRFMSDGRRQIGAFYYPGDMIGPEMTQVHRFSAEALSPATVLVVKPATLRAAGADGVLEAVFRDATRCELERMQQHVLALGRRGACEKVAGFLLDVAHRDAGGLIALNMSRQDIADYLGLTIETVSRSFTQLQDEQVVKAVGARRFQVCRGRELQRLAA
jgi:CRP/FNR family transcriptional regulator, nitrogen fixation regulation protein